VHLDLLGNPSSGGNCYLLAAADTSILIDAGLAWSSQRELGIDFTVPHLTAEQARASAIVITHPHEDHIGALAYLLDQMPSIPRILCGPVTADILRLRLAETKHAVTPEVVAPYAWTRERGIRLQMLPVPHSASESMALYLEVDGKRILYSGDLRGSDDTGYGHLPAKALAEHSGVDLLMLEAVRADVNEPDPTLADLKEGLLAALNRLEGRRVIFSAFASNITRIQIVIELAASIGRECFLLGRSMHKTVEIAKQFSRMPARGWTLGPPPKDAPNGKTLLVVAGAQGEPDAGLSRLIRGHYPVQARRGDGLIMSSTPIPGNEEPFWSLVEMAMQKGVEVLTYRDYLVHLSGHSTAAELQRIMRLTKPQWVVPFHGDYYRHQLMQELGSRAGISPKRFVVAANGDRVTLTKEKPQVRNMDFTVDSYQLGKGRQRTAALIEPDTVDERRRMLRAGTVILRGGHRGASVESLNPSDEVRALIDGARDRKVANAELKRQLLRLPSPPVVVDVG
jgi:ribonuclease J